MLRKMLKSNEALMGCLILIIIIVFSFLSPEFRSLATVFNMVRGLLITSIVAIALLLVFISGGIDMSFMAVASFAMYATVKIMIALGGYQSIFLAFLIGGGIGIVLGLINAFFVTVTKLPIFIVTLATQFLFKGASMAFVGVKLLQAPESMIQLSKTNLITAKGAGDSEIGLNVSILIVITIYLLVFLILKYTKFGRNLYAIGGSITAAKCAGINVKLNLVCMFALVGFISAIAGVLNAALLRLAIAGDLIGGELPVLAAVILGGAKAAEGKGTVLGTLLGVILIIIISNSLNLIKIPSYWQGAVLGLIIIIGTVWQSATNNKAAAV